MGQHSTLNEESRDVMMLLLCHPDGFVLRDGARRAFMPWTASKRLANVPHSVRVNWRWIGKNHGIHWPDVDEDLKVENIFKEFETK